ncbi:MAG TPA: alanyl-tRNA editing protein [Candidatus Bathyarchaeia archaeon]
MTVKLYDRDHYLGEFDARVVGVEGDAVELDQTAFYAEAGGQAGDTGTLNGVRVADTRVDGGRILHFMESPPGLSQGDRVHGVVDWDRRYRIMKLHTASHIMEYYLWMHLGYAERTGSFVDERKDRADYRYEERLDPEKLKRVEEDTNRFLSQGHPVTIQVDDDGIRHWSCGPVEMHCAGTHVRNTREIGAIRLKRKNPGRSEERVETSLAE